MRLRIITAHKYFKVDLTIIWYIISKDIPETELKIRKTFDELFENKNEEK
ncbi:MAG: HepT-like ribonuclease domain-containing protein [Promethearchaeota archaeon]